VIDRDGRDERGREQREHRDSRNCQWGNRNTVDGGHPYGGDRADHHQQRHGNQAQLGESLAGDEAAHQRNRGARHEDRQCRLGGGQSPGQRVEQHHQPQGGEPANDGSGGDAQMGRPTGLEETSWCAINRFNHRGDGQIHQPGVDEQGRGDGTDRSRRSAA
jgi:hypothetical protein